MPLSDAEKQEIASKVKADLKSKHTDWDETKLETEAKKQVGRKVKDAENKRAEEDRFKKTREELKALEENKNLSDDDLDTKTKQRIEQEDYAKELKRLVKVESEAGDKFVQASNDRRNFESSKGGKAKKSDSLTKEEKEILAVFRKNKSNA